MNELAWSLLGKFSAYQLSEAAESLSLKQTQYLLQYEEYIPTCLYRELMEYRDFLEEEEGE